MKLRTTNVRQKSRHPSARAGLTRSRASLSNCEKTRGRSYLIFRSKHCNKDRFDSKPNSRNNNPHTRNTARAIQGINILTQNFYRFFSKRPEDPTIYSFGLGESRQDRYKQDLDQNSILIKHIVTGTNPFENMKKLDKILKEGLKCGRDLGIGNSEQYDYVYFSVPFKQSKILGGAENCVIYKRVPYNTICYDHAQHFNEYGFNRNSTTVGDRIKYYGPPFKGMAEVLIPKNVPVEQFAGFTRVEKFFQVTKIDAEAVNKINNYIEDNLENFALFNKGNNALIEYYHDFPREENFGFYLRMSYDMQKIKGCEQQVKDFFDEIISLEDLLEKAESHNNKKDAEKKNALDKPPKSEMIQVKLETVSIQKANCVSPQKR